MKHTMIVNPASVGVEWTDEGTTYQLAAVRGGTQLLFAMKPAGGDWSSPAVVTNPERFVDGPINTVHDMRAVAAKWFAAGERAKEKEQADD